jgi:hypothetical protein
VQEPFGWYYMEHGEIRDVEWTRQKPTYEGTWKPLYTTPPAAQKPWVGLSEEEINKLRHLVDWTAEWSYDRFAYHLERLLREKNGGAA